MSEKELKTLQDLRVLAGRIPCELCHHKGGDNIQPDGGCRHRPMVDSPITDQEVINRLSFAVNFLFSAISPTSSVEEEPEHNHFGEVFLPSTCPGCKFLANKKSGQ